MNPIRRCIYLLLVPFVISMSGCIVSDSHTTVTISGDGSADVVIYRSNIRSTQKGDRARAELDKYGTEFSSREGGDFTRFQQVGADKLDSGWIRSQTPSSNYLRAHLPTASALEQYYTFQDGKGRTIVRTTFTQSAKGGRIEMTFSLGDIKLSDGNKNEADDLSIIRFALTDQLIQESQGFVVASDKQSALLDMKKLFEQLDANAGQTTIFFEFE